MATATYIARLRPLVQSCDEPSWTAGHAAFLGLEQTHNPFRWALPVTPASARAADSCSAGVGWQRRSRHWRAPAGVRLVWATAQYLIVRAPGEVLDIDVTLAVEGHQITQARAVGHVGNREILTVNAALGERPSARPASSRRCGRHRRPRSVPAARVHRLDPAATINDQLEERLVKGRDVDDLDGTLGDGQTLMWARIPEVIEGIDATTLAILGDFVPMGVGMALGIQGGGNSLDNTLRVVRLVPTEWVLLDIRVHGVERGFGHGLVAHVRRGRHPAGDGQPELHRALWKCRPERPQGRLDSRPWPCRPAPE